MGELGEAWKDGRIGGGKTRRKNRKKKLEREGKREVWIKAGVEKGQR